MPVAEGNQPVENELESIIDLQEHNTGEALVFVVRDEAQKIIGAQIIARMKSFSSVPADQNKSVFQLSDGVVHPDHHNRHIFSKLLTDALQDGPEIIKKWILEQPKSPERDEIIEQLQRPSVYLEIDELNPTRDSIINAFYKAAKATGWGFEGDAVDGITGPLVSAVVETDDDQSKTFVNTKVGERVEVLTPIGSLRARESIIKAYEGPLKAFEQIMGVLPKIDWYKSEPGYKVINGQGSDQGKNVEALNGAAHRFNLTLVERATTLRFAATKTI